MPTSSVTQASGLEQEYNGDYQLQVSRGLVNGHTAIFRSAYSNAITTSQNYTVWPRAANYVFPVSASTMTLSSSATGDVGQPVLIEGLDANYNVISEVLVLNGQTAVTSTLSYFRINEMTVLVDSPTGSLYFGTGTVIAGVPANVYGFIAPTDNNMMAAIYTVPAGYTLYIYGGSINAALGNSNKLVTVRFAARINNVVYQEAPIQTMGGYQHYPYTPPLVVPEKADIWDTATTTDTTTSSVVANFSGILIKN